MKRLFAFLLSVSLSAASFADEYHVAKTGSDRNPGDRERPFLTISKAAEVALAGDSVIVHEGVYREWVSPGITGISDQRRVSFLAASGERVFIKGSEVVSGWKKLKGRVWKAEVGNELFGDFNPFAINLTGDWLTRGKNLHLGEVYLDGIPFREVESSDRLADEGTWYAEVDDRKTAIYVNFGGKDPGKGLVEINVRPTCFFPKSTGINYITVKGFHFSQAATQWSAPTSEQIGIVGPNWSKGWVIEDCEVSYSKCVGICLGKPRGSGHNMWTLYKGRYGYMKCGFNREIESVFKAIDLGWSKENVGSHLVRNNTIHDCGQSGIVGHMGGAFSRIEHNEIFNINRTEGRIGGAETAGIKLHAAIDTWICDNYIHNAVMGIWLDWQAQGTQVFSNIIVDSEKQDLFLEVSHGPTMVYDNCFLSNLGCLVTAQGIAFFNNLIKGKIRAGGSAERYTPYHEPHSTKVKGLFNNTGGDVRFYNNVFLGYDTPEIKGSAGLSEFNRFPEYADSLAQNVTDTPAFLTFHFPVWADCNVYFGKAKPFKAETVFTCREDMSPEARVVKKEGWYRVELSSGKEIVSGAESVRVDTGLLGQTFISEALFENPDGTAFSLENKGVGPLLW